MSNDLREALRLEAAAHRRDNLLCLMHNYTGYPMIREARAAIAVGELGRVHLVQVSYLMGSLGTRIEDDAAHMPNRLKWRLDPARGGLSHALADVGSHAHHLATYVTGDTVASVFADLGAAVEGRSAHDTAAMIVRMRRGARGTILASKAASGAENGITLEVYGEKGGLRWGLANPGQLHVMRPGQPTAVRSPGLPTLHPLAKHSSRRGGGAGDAFIEGFANLYSDFSYLVAARLAGDAPNPLAAQVPGLADGLAGLRFIEACLASSESKSWAEVTDEPGPP